MRTLVNLWGISECQESGKLVAPENSDGTHLKTLAKLAKILKSNSLRQLLMEAPTREKLYEAIIQEDEEF